METTNAASSKTSHLELNTRSAVLRDTSGHWRAGHYPAVMQLLLCFFGDRLLRRKQVSDNLLVSRSRPWRRGQRSESWMTIGLTR